MVQESKMYKLVRDRLLERVTVSLGQEVEAYIEVKLSYGPIRSDADIVFYKWKELEENYPSTRELVEMHVCECKPYLYTYRAYGQLLHYKSIVDLYLNSGHFLAYNEDFCDGVREFWKAKKRFPKYWDKHLETQSFERLSTSLKLYLYLVLLYDQRNVDKEEFGETTAFHKRCLNSFLDGAVGLCAVYYPSKYVYFKKEPWPIEIRRSSGRKPESYFEANTACIVRKRKTWRYCPWFVDGKYWRCRYTRARTCIGSKCRGYRDY